MKTLFLMMAAMVALTGFLPAAQAAPAIGKPAPDFTGTDSLGKTHKLSDLKGKTVVLEWTNPECPFVVRHYSSGTMQQLQQKYTKEGIVWLSINSSAEGKQGYETPDEANATFKENEFQSTALILDPKGEIGHLYDAKTTPHMFVIDKEGVLVYEGAIDDNDSAKPSDKPAKNYVSTALESLAAGKPVEVSQTKPYGCGVKY